MIHILPRLPAQPGERFTLRQAAEWLLDHAATEPQTVPVRGGQVRLQPGEMLTSLNTLSGAWNMSRRWAGHTLDALARERFCETVPETHGTRIILCEYKALTQAVARTVAASVAAAPVVPNMRESVASVGDLVAWCKAARPGDAVTYHMGNLAHDRAQSPVLHELAEMVLILTERDYLRTEQVRARLATLVGYSYLAVKTGRGGVVPSIMEQRVTPVHYRALLALGQRHGVQSAQRCLRDGMGLSEDGATALLRELQAKGLIEPSPSRGMVVTRKGLSMVV